jgi:hypothetical protein
MYNFFSESISGIQPRIPMVAPHLHFWSLKFPPKKRRRLETSLLTRAAWHQRGTASGNKSSREQIKPQQEKETWN